MAHLHRFHRRKKDVAAPALITNDLPGESTTPAPDTRGASPMRSLQKLSPFRVFQRSAKRARDSPPASLPHSPAAAPVLPGGGRPVSPLSLKMDPPRDDKPKPANPPKMPAFLEQTEEEIESKFLELVWRERNRLMQSVANPSPDFRWARVKGPHLKVLDRYINVQPWQNNRVKLRVPDGQLDYINASPIVLAPTARPGDPAPEPDHYIAMQGPKHASTDHVWRMVVEQLESPGVIVMLTETHEGPMEKCFPYFPRSRDDPPLEINERDEFGDGFRATVRCEGLEETPAGDAIELRKLVIRVHSRPAAAATTSPSTPPPTAPAEGSPTGQDAEADTKMKSPTTRSTPPSPSAPTNNPLSAVAAAAAAQAQDQPTAEDAGGDGGGGGGGEEKIIYHFLYKKWPDFGVPSLADLDSFFTLMHLSRARNRGPRNPRIVHCSAGVGRSGTFIALEHLMRALDSGALEDWDARAAAPGGREGPDSSSSPSTRASSRSGEGPAGPDPFVAAGPEGSVPGAGAGESAAAGSASGSGSGSGSGNGSGNGPSPPATSAGEDLVFETVNALREQRRTMVQADSQYLFIYQVLRKLWVDKYYGGAAAAASAGEDGDVNMAGDDDDCRDDDDDGETSDDRDGEPAAKRLEVDPSVAAARR